LSRVIEAVYERDVFWAIRDMDLLVLFELG